MGQTLRTILLAGLICGSLDALSAVAASAFFGRRPIQVFQGIASGILGVSSFKGGLGTALLGLGLHFLIATGASVVFFAASRVIPSLIDRPLLFGPLYGAAVHFFMSFVVIPLSAIGPRPFEPRSFVTFLIIAMIVVGPSIALTVRFYTR